MVAADLVQRVFVRHAPKVTCAFEGRVCTVAMIEILCECHALPADLSANLLQAVVCLVETLGSTYGNLGSTDNLADNLALTRVHTEVDMVANVGSLDEYLRRRLKEYAQRHPNTIQAMAASIGVSQFDVMYRHWFNELENF